MDNLYVSRVICIFKPLYIVVLLRIIINCDPIGAILIRGRLNERLMGLLYADYSLFEVRICGV